MQQKEKDDEVRQVKADGVRRQAVNSYFTVSKMNRLHVPRVSEDQLQAPDQVPIVPREEACTTREFQ